MKNQFHQLVTDTDAAKQRLIEAIRKLPEAADGVKVISSNCCTVSFSEMQKHNNLSACYWVTAGLKQELVEAVENNKSIDTTVKMIESILATGIFRLASGRIQNIHPSIVKELKRAWEGA